MEYNEYRRKSKKIGIGNTFIGGDSQVKVQSMTNVSSADFSTLFSQMLELQNVGCDIVRMTVPDESSARNISRLKESGIFIPIVADVHFDFRLAVLAADCGADKIRINPGNIGDESRILEVVKACRKNRCPIRIGVNSGSLEKHVLEKYGMPSAEALSESALYNASLLEKFDFDDIVISVKSSDVRTMIESYRMLSQRCIYPLHLGVTEAGTSYYGSVKSFVGIGSLLSDGIGDTIRISLTDSPTEEVKEGKRLLDSLGIGSRNIQIISCPTCGRTKIDLIPIVNELEKTLADVHPSHKIKVAIMGCAVNGPGEAREADIGVAGGVGEALLFRHGTVQYKIPQNKIVEILTEEIKKL